MVYFLNKNLLMNKNIRVELQRIYGINDGKAKELCGKIVVHKYAKVKNIKPKKFHILNKFILENYKIGSELSNIVNSNLKKKIQIKSYSGMRYIYGLPMRGQRSKTNASTARRLHKLAVLNIK